VHFLPDPALVPDAHIPVPELRQLTGAFGPSLAVKITDEHA
jgi:hypothetical protein